MKIAVLISGGVDSSVALRLLKDQGHEVTAFYLKIWLENELSFLGSCPWQEDLSYVQAVCEQAGVPLEVLNLQKEYQDAIVSYTINEIKAGRTPNPDVLCNNRIKFGVFLDHLEGSFEKIATGHYAQVEEHNGICMLKKSPDPIKDQTYFLSYMHQHQLQRALFPIGHLTKIQVREMAQRYNLATKDRKDSQGLCFLGKIKFADFIKHHLGEQPGPLIEFETGQQLGSHPGCWFFTIGQRKGSGLAGGPWYVVAKDFTSNAVFISRNYYRADKIRNACTVDQVNWISGVAPKKFAVQVKVRHGEQMYQGTLAFQPEGTLNVVLNDRDQGIAPGQFAVFYDGDYCLGSGVIVHPLPGLSKR